MVVIGSMGRLNIELLGWDDDAGSNNDPEPSLGATGALLAFDPPTSPPQEAAADGSLLYSELEATQPYHGSGFESMGSTFYRHFAPAAVPSRGPLHKKRLAAAPKPCTNGELPPWISMRGSGHLKGSSKRTKPKIDAGESLQSTLRRLRGAYLPLHAEEQARIPLMASGLDVQEMNREHERMIGNRLEGLVTLNRELHYSVDSFWRRRRTWTRRGGRRKPKPAPESAIEDFDQPRRPDCEEVRNIYRANAKLIPPPKSGLDTSNPCALYVHRPHPEPEEPEGNNEEEPEVLEDPLSPQHKDFVMLSPAQMRVKIFEMSNEMSGILKEAHAMAPPRYMND